MKQGDCTIFLVKTKALIICMVTVQLICAFVFAYAKNRSSHDSARILLHVSAHVVLFLLFHCKTGVNIHSFYHVFIMF